MGLPVLKWHKTAGLTLALGKALLFYPQLGVDCAMMKKFSTLLLTGKAATLPLLMQQAHAQTLTPTYTDIVTTQVTQVELPVLNKVQPIHWGSSPSLGSATLCDNMGVPNTLSLVLTGLKNDEIVFVATSTNIGGNEMLNPNVKIGTAGLQVPIGTGIVAPPDGTVALTVPLNLATLGYSLTPGNSFYLQTFVFPPGSFQNGFPTWANARISELDKISVGTCRTY